MQGKTVVVTGANSGLGRATAQDLARRGARVLMTARDPEKGQEALESIRAATGNESVELLLADFARLSDVRSLAAAILQRCERIDVLVNNAGLILKKRFETEDGHEQQMQVNHLAPFLLTSLLLDRLRASAPARVITLSSSAHWVGGLDPTDLSASRGYWGFRVYSQTKLANILFTRELARRLEGSGVTANAVHPGVVATGFGAVEDAGRLFGFGAWLISPFVQSPAKGARTSIHLASSPELAETSGGYFARCRPARTSRAARDPELAAQLWEASEALVGLR